jgi:PAS domain S-box-containing protein
MGAEGADDRPERAVVDEFLFEHTTDCIVEGVVRDGEPIVYRVNDAFEDVFGYEESALHGENLNDFVVPEGRRDGAETIDREIRDGEIGPREVTRLTADGPREFLLRATGGEGERSYAIYTDITEQKERERGLRTANERLERFARVVSHDLRNPLDVASGHLDAVARAHERNAVCGRRGARRRQ